MAHEGSSGVPAHRALALRALALVVGFYVLALAASFGLLTVVAMMVRAGRFRPSLLTAVFTALVILGAVVGIERRGTRGAVPGIAAEDRDRRLVEFVTETAEMMGARPPAEVRFVADVNAAAVQRSRLLGLVPGPTSIVLGLGLVTALSVDELRAVVAHELGHLHRRDARLGGVVYRTRLALERASMGLTGPFGAMFGAYERLFLRWTTKVARAQEEAADAMSIEVAGPVAVGEALLRTATADLAFDWYFDRYVSLVLDDGRWPSDLIGGFARILTNPERAGELAELRAELALEEASPYDSHPPILERVATAMALSVSAPEPGPRQPARTLLDDPDATERAVAAHLGVLATGDPSGGIEWADVADGLWQPRQQRVAETVLAATAWVLQRERGDLVDNFDYSDDDEADTEMLAAPEEVFEILDRGADEELVRALYSGFEDLDGIERERTAPEVIDAALFAVVGHALVTRRECRWRLSDSGPIELVDADGFAIDLEALAAQARRGGEGRASVKAAISSPS